MKAAQRLTDDGGVEVFLVDDGGRQVGPGFRGYDLLDLPRGREVETLTRWARSYGYDVPDTPGA